MRTQQNPTLLKLQQIMLNKQTNLTVSADVTTGNELLKLAEQVGPHICTLKTHIDIIEDFSPKLIKELKAMANDLQFILFEDRKFADIGATVVKQYTSGIYQIASWADLVNIHPLVGPGAIEGIGQVAADHGSAILLLGQMSSKGNLITPQYTNTTVKLAIQYQPDVIGFIAQEGLSDDPNLITFSPGVHLTSEGDSLGQQYRSPEQAIMRDGVDVIIVGRDIYKNANPKERSKTYQAIGWNSSNNKLKDN